MDLYKIKVEIRNDINKTLRAYHDSITKLCDEAYISLWKFFKPLINGLTEEDNLFIDKEKYKIEIINKKNHPKEDPMIIIWIKNPVSELENIYFVYLFKDKDWIPKKIPVTHPMKIRERIIELAKQLNS